MSVPSRPSQPTTRDVPDDDGVTIAEYTEYREAQAAVDALSDAGLEMRGVRIVGRGMSSVEIVTGRMTKGRAAGLGAASGAWFGLFIALLIGLFVPAPAWLWLLLVGILVGALWGAVFGFAGHWATGGRRDFSSVSTLSAERYEVIVPRDRAPRARQLLGQYTPPEGARTTQPPPAQQVPSTQPPPPPPTGQPTDPAPRGQ